MTLWLHDADDSFEARMILLTHAATSSCLVVGLLIIDHNIRPHSKNGLISFYFCTHGVILSVSRSTCRACTAKKDEITL